MKPPHPVNAFRLLWMGILALVASGMCFSIRASLLIEWGVKFGLSQTELGSITGGGLLGFGLIVVVGSALAEAFGYKRIMFGAVICQILSVAVSVSATPIFTLALGFGPEEARSAAYWVLYVGMFLFAVGNGLAEAVINPLTAAVFPTEKTRFLNILHAGWCCIPRCFVRWFPGETVMRMC